MILDLILQVVLGFMSWVGSFLPSWPGLDLATPIENAFTTVGPMLGLVAWLNLYLPLTELFALLVLLSGIWLASHVYNAVVWLLSKLHILGGGSQ